MAFAEVGGHAEKSGKGLELHWRNLEENCCPKCAEDLVYFEHILLWKCPCGFKIGNEKLVSIQSNIDEQNFSRGFAYGNYDDESPF